MTMAISLPFIREYATLIKNRGGGRALPWFPRRFGLPFTHMETSNGVWAFLER